MSKSFRPTTTSYVTGFILSLLLTLTAYFVVVNQVFVGWNLVLLIMGLGVAQLIVQLLFFLHLGSEKKPHWNLIVFLFMLLVLVILVFGSLWIMNNLNYHMMSPQQTEEYMKLQNQKGF